MNEPVAKPMAALAVEPRQLSKLDDSFQHMRPIPGSRMFEIGDALKVYRAAHPGAETYDASQGDGGASLPGVSDELLERAFVLQKEHGTGYDKPFGTSRFREAVVRNYWKLDPALGWSEPNVIACHGGRDGLVKAYDAMLALGHGRRGDFIATTRVPWISYTWGPYGVGGNLMLAPGDDKSAWKLTPEGVAACVDQAASYDGRKVAAVVVTSPDNPTGRTLTMDEQVAIAAQSFALGVPYVLFDWIYHRVTDEQPYDVNELLGALEPEHRERCVVLDGLTKSLGASNLRSAHLLASQDLVLHIQKRASHGVIPSFFSQAVAIAAYEMGFDEAAATIVGPTNASRKVLQAFLDDHDLPAITGKGYYAFINLARWIDEAGMKDAADMGSYLAERHGLAVVPGVYFSRFARTWIRFSYALPPERTAAAAERLWTALGEL